VTTKHPDTDLRMIPVDQIAVLNPRERNNRVFEEIIGNIKTIGLKKPITVTCREGLEDGKRYLLICGEGRLKAFKALGHRDIPALVVDVSDEDAFVMSLTENIARRQYRPLELLAGIDRLREQGYGPKEIADKIGLGTDYIKGILMLLKSGEERLLVAVQGGRIPLNAAIDIARAGSDDTATQAALQEAYESGKLRGVQLIHARRIIDRRRTLGRSESRRPTRKTAPVTSVSLVRTYQREVDRQKLLIKKAEFAQQRLLFIVEAMRQLLAEENFSNLLRAEGLDTLPKHLAERVWPGSHAA
jgi:ParB family transcriptional regulator, chromosome partitioning protein